MRRGFQSTWRLRRQRRDTSNCRLVKAISSRPGITGMTQTVANMLGSRATTKLSGEANILLRQSGANKMAVTALTRDAGKRTIRVSDHQYNPPIEKAPLAGAFLCVLPGYQGVRQPSQSRASPSPSPQPNHLRRSGPHSDLDCPGVA